MKRKELIIVSILTLIIAFMDISGLPSSLFINIKVLDINPIYFALMFNFIVIGIVSFFTLRLFCPDWYLGFTSKNLKMGFKKYSVAGIIAGILSGIAFYIGLKPFNYNPTVLKILIEGIIYYIGVSMVEELMIRGLLLNIIEKMINNKNNTVIAIILSSIIFGLGHIFGAIDQPLLVIITKVTFTIAMGIYFGTIYKKTNNLWLPIILHFMIDICSLPYCFTTITTYPDISLCIILPTYILLGIYSIVILKRKNEFFTLPSKTDNEIIK